MVNRFEWVIARRGVGSDVTCDVDLLSAGLAAVVPTLGSLMPGWVLVIPRTPALSLRQISPLQRLEILRFAETVGSLLSTFGKNVYILEHGPVKKLSTIGCGVDQAHLHVLATDLDLKEVLFADPLVQWSLVDGDDPWDLISEDREYYLFRNNTEAYIGCTDIVMSQYFRRQIATALKVPQMWNYREFPFYEHVRETINIFECRSKDGCSFGRIKSA